jgi:hypothetical protein
MTASMAWLRLGNGEESIRNYIDWQQMDYMRAETPAAYAEVRELLLRGREMAEQIGSRDQAFKAAGLAADCSFWASDAARPPESHDLLLQALRDIIAASELADPAGKADYERYVSLLAAAATTAMGTVWPEQREPEAQSLLRRLAAASDQTIPVEFRYEQVGDPVKTANTASILTALADGYGS